MCAYKICLLVLKASSLIYGGNVSVPISSSDWAVLLLNLYASRVLNKFCTSSKCSIHHCFSSCDVFKTTSILPLIYISEALLPLVIVLQYCCVKSFSITLNRCLLCLWSFGGHRSPLFLYYSYTKWSVLLIAFRNVSLRRWLSSISKAIVLFNSRLFAAVM